MDALKQLKEVSLSVLPIAVISALLALFLGVIDGVGLLKFVLSSIFVIVGLTLFLLGVNIGLLPVGNKLGSTVTRSRSLVVIILVALLLGFIITVAEPDVQVLASQVAKVNTLLDQTCLYMQLGLGLQSF